MIYNTKNKYGLEQAKEAFKRLINKQAIIELGEKKKTRTSAQNRALHLFFTQISEQLN